MLYNKNDLFPRLSVLTNGMQQCFVKMTCENGAQYCMISMRMIAGLQSYVKQIWNSIPAPPNCSQGCAIKDQNESLNPEKRELSMQSDRDYGSIQQSTIWKNVALAGYPENQGM